MATEKRSGLSAPDGILLDISIKAASGLNQMLVLSQDVCSVSPQLLQLQESIPKLTVLVSPSACPVAPSALTVQERPVRRAFGSECSSPTASPPVFLGACPVYQHMVRREGQTASHDLLIHLMRELAETGSLMTSLEELAGLLSKQCGMSSEHAMFTLKSAVQLRLVNVTERKFGKLKEVAYASLLLKSLSLEGLLWTLRSLKVDEMMPTERAIQSRVKETFEFKPSPEAWANLMEVCRTGDAKGHFHSYSAPLEDFLLSSEGVTQHSIPEFRLKEFTDPISGVETHLVYPKDEQWEGFDQYIKEGDVLNIKETVEWGAFYEFLSNYFLSKHRKADEGRGMPGGRYGCAQFLQHCGPPCLKSSSLGKLVYIVQLAINEDLLRYHKTLLIWMPFSASSQSREVLRKKLGTLRATMIELLKHSRGGVSLAQLPFILRKKLPFHLDLHELGFPKLKDFLKTVPNVEIEVRGANHPFALYNPQVPVPRILASLEGILNDCLSGLPGPEAEELLRFTLGRQPRWDDYNSATIYEFIRKHGKSQFEVINSFIVKRSIKTLLNPSVRHTEDFYKQFNANDPSPGITVSSLPRYLPTQESGVLDFETEEISRSFLDNLLSDEEEDSFQRHGSLREKHTKAYSEELKAEEKPPKRLVRSYYDGFSDLPPGFT